MRYLFSVLGFISEQFDLFIRRSRECEAPIDVRQAMVFAASLSEAL